MRFWRKVYSVCGRYPDEVIGSGKAPVTRRLFGADRHTPLTLRRSDAFCAEDEIRLKPGKGDQESDQRILDPHGAPPVLFQATEVSEDQRLATDGVRQTIAPNHWHTLYRSADAADVTRVTARLCHFQVCRGCAVHRRHGRQKVGLPLTAEGLASSGLKGRSRTSWSFSSGRREGFADYLRTIPKVPYGSPSTA
jgi:hypothetical protein